MDNNLLNREVEKQKERIKEFSGMCYLFHSFRQKCGYRINSLFSRRVRNFRKKKQVSAVSSLFCWTWQSCRCFTAGELLHRKPVYKLSLTRNNCDKITDYKVVLAVPVTNEALGCSRAKFIRLFDMAREDLIFIKKNIMRSRGRRRGNVFFNPDLR